VQPATTANVIKAAMNTTELPDYIPVTEEMKLTV
jgi:hypothetical protein